ncbi:MAG: hypothetical protein LBJ20_07025 [Candidatus Methanoplasma sp.]|nr:hypothetical protein [Candidatus Methanoplasma sp.]
MRFYVSKCHNKLNGSIYDPENYSDYLCINPYYSVEIDPTLPVRFMIDSGAFQDVGKSDRLSFDDALVRQLNFENKVTGGKKKAECIVSYDRLVDEQLGESGQIKERVSGVLAEEYVKETIDAARFLSEKREDLNPRQLVLSCQGTNVDQYLKCIKSVLKVATSDDMIGFGGFCIMSKSLDYEKQFYEIINKAFPLIHKKGITRVHIFGVGIFRALIQADVYARMNGLECSYDTSSPEMNATFGKVFNPMSPGLNAVYSKIHKKNGYHPAELALFNVKAINNFWESHRTLPLPEKFVPGIVPSRKATKPLDYEILQIKDGEENF